MTAEEMAEFIADLLYDESVDNDKIVKAHIIPGEPDMIRVKVYDEKSFIITVNLDE